MIYPNPILDKEMKTVEFLVLWGTVLHLITLHRFNSKKEFILNADQIKYIEETPDTVITLTNNEKVLVHESAKDVVKASIEYGRAIRSTVHLMSQPHL